MTLSGLRCTFKIRKHSTPECKENKLYCIDIDSISDHQGVLFFTWTQDRRNRAESERLEREVCSSSHPRGSPRHILPSGKTSDIVYHAFAFGNGTSPGIGRASVAVRMMQLGMAPSGLTIHT